MCNNRCVFCVSGQRSAQRVALPIDGSEVIERLRDGRSQGLRKVTLLGGEPTIQPDFLDVVRAAVELGFEEIVVFTNGVKTARGEFVDAVLATGGRFTWRLSFQGATALAHERTTKKLGSFSRLSQTLVNLRERGQRVTVNMCVVQSNYASVVAFPELVLSHGVVQLHLDMVRPLDAGVRTEDELRAMIPKYSDMVVPLTSMVDGFEKRSPGFDVNIGNLPYCIAPALAPWIHHDGETTFTVSADNDDRLSTAWDKYQVKRRDKLKPTRCAQCVFDPMCSGVFETYERFYGLDEIQPITAERLVVLDPSQRMFTLHVKSFVSRLSDWALPLPFTAMSARENSRDGEYTLRFDEDHGGFVTVALRRGGRGAGGVAATDRFSLHLVDASDGGAATESLLRELFARLCDDSGATVLHSVAADAGFHSPHAKSLAPEIDWRIGQCLARLRAKAPFGSLTWRTVALEAQGRTAVIDLDTEDGNTVSVSISVKGMNVSGGYRLRHPVGQPSASLVASVRGVMDALRGP